MAGETRCKYCKGIIMSNCNEENEKELNRKSQYDYTKSKDVLKRVCLNIFKQKEKQSAITYSMKTGNYYQQRKGRAIQYLFWFNFFLAKKYQDTLKSKMNGSE